MSRRVASTERIGNLRVLEPRTHEIIRSGAVLGQWANPSRTRSTSMILGLQVS